MYADITTAVTTALASIKTAGELVNLVLQTKVNAAVTEKAREFQSAIISLQSAILSIQAQNQELLVENGRLKQELINAENWEAEAAKYELKQVSTGAFVYAVKPDQAGTGPTHWLCTQCYENKQKSILQRGDALETSGHTYSCNNCKLRIFAYPT
jgi:hypothetical protein